MQDRLHPNTHHLAELAGVHLQVHWKCASAAKLGKAVK